MPEELPPLAPVPAPVEPVEAVAPKDPVPAPVLTKETMTKGLPVKVKISGILTPATYYGWSEKYNMPLVLCDGKVIPRRVFPRETTEETPVEAPAAKVDAPKTAFPLTMSVRAEQRLNGSIEYFNCVGDKIYTMIPHEVGSRKSVAEESESVKTRVED